MLLTGRQRKAFVRRLEHGRKVDARRVPPGGTAAQDGGLSLSPVPRKVESGSASGVGRRMNPADEITPEIFAHLVHLAELELGPDEAEYLRRQLNSQLRAIHEMASIQVDSETPITSHGVPYPPQARPPLREDETRSDDEADAILGQTPETASRYIVVPDIPHTDLT